MRPSWPGGEPSCPDGSRSMETRMDIKHLVTLFWAATIGGVLLGIGASACERMVSASGEKLGLEIQKFQQTSESAAELLKEPLLLGQEDRRDGGRRGDVSDLERADVLATHEEVA